MGKCKKVGENKYFPEIWGNVKILRRGDLQFKLND